MTSTKGSKYTIQVRYGLHVIYFNLMYNIVYCSWIYVHTHIHKLKTPFVLENHEEYE